MDDLEIVLQLVAGELEGHTMLLNSCLDDLLIVLHLPGGVFQDPPGRLVTVQSLLAHLVVSHTSPVQLNKPHNDLLLHRWLELIDLLHDQNDNAFVWPPPSEKTVHCYTCQHLGLLRVVVRKCQERVVELQAVLCVDQLIQRLFAGVDLLDCPLWHNHVYHK